MTAVTALLEGLVDYAGLFPPASEDMRIAAENFASYRDGPDARALGRFIVPVARLGEFESAARDAMRRGGEREPWRLSVLVSTDTRAAGEEMLKFNCHHWTGSEDGHAVIDAVELKAGTVEAIESQHRDLPPFFQRYFEIPLDPTTDALVKAIARCGARAKIRTGGTTANAFPNSRHVLAFIESCLHEKVPFKATAGLHHPIRGAYRLTYEPDGESGTMYGFLNVFLAAALLYSGEGESVALQALEESNPRAFRFSEDAVTWASHRIESARLRDVRREFAISFGSCSFREPVDELTRLISGNA